MRAALVALVAALAFAPAAQAKPHYLRFKITSVWGHQTVNWHETLGDGGCGGAIWTGSQTISFKSTRPARLRLRKIGRHNYYGVNFIRANWTFSRSFQQSSPPPGCPPDPERGGQVSDCGTQGPFAVPIDVGWRDGAVELRGVLDPGSERSPEYKACNYDGSHEEDLIDSKGRLSVRRLTHRHTLRAKVSRKASDESQTTSLKATVTLKRVR
jgi:hypothetical protein